MAQKYSIWNDYGEYKGRVIPCKLSAISISAPYKKAVPLEWFLWIFLHSQFFKNTTKFDVAKLFRVEFSPRIGHQSLVRTINRRLLTTEYPFCRPARCPRLARDHRRRRRQWARRHHDWDLRHWRESVPEPANLLMGAQAKSLALDTGHLSQ